MLLVRTNLGMWFSVRARNHYFTSSQLPILSNVEYEGHPCPPGYYRLHHYDTSQPHVIFIYMERSTTGQVNYVSMWKGRHVGHWLKLPLPTSDSLSSPIPRKAAASIPHFRLILFSRFLSILREVPANPPWPIRMQLTKCRRLSTSAGSCWESWLVYRYTLAAT